MTEPTNARGQVFRVGVRAPLSARHRLVGGDFGAENELHAHPYRMSVEVEGGALDAHGFLVDIDALRGALGTLVTRLTGAVLNDQPELAGLNPSVENLARMLAEALVAALPTGLPTGPNASLTVEVWEGEDAWASFTRPL